MRLTGLRTALLRWFDKFGRDLPWRVRGAPGNPYRVWLSEIMLQQTVVAAATPYFLRFTELWPDVAALANAPREDVLREWAGLGYYARARNLHACAQRLAAEGFPADEAGWRALPGIGPYTAAALAAIALDQPANVVDGNVERVMARLLAVETPLPDAKPQLREHAASLVTVERPGDWAQALMDLGATICTPKSPKCGACPVSQFCAALATGAPEAFPRKRAKAERPHRHGVAFWLEHDGRVLLTTRPDKGLLGGMAALPSTPWRDDPWTEEEARALAPAKAKWKSVGAVEHTFTHFSLTLEVWRGAEKLAARAPQRWVALEEVDKAGQPTVFRKAANRARAE